MDWLIGLSLLIVGGIIGFFVAKYFSKEQLNESDTSASELTVQELMHQQAGMHIQQTKQIAEKLVVQSTALQQQVENYEQLLISQQAGPEGSSLNYFGEHTTAYLRNKSAKPTREKSSADIQPLDFSSQSSGLFSGQQEMPAKETK